jgi:hypothetical protein
MATRAEHDHAVMVAALRAVLASDPEDAGRPSRLRLHLDGVLGPDEAHRLRRLVHQVVAASEDNLPVNLTRIAPLTAESLQRLSGELAQARGWTDVVSRRTTQIWATALGFEELVASSWPREPVPERPAAGPVAAHPVAATSVPPAPPAPRAAATAPAWPAPSRQVARLTHGLEGGAWAAVVGYAGLPLALVAALFTALVIVLCLPIFLLDANSGLLTVVGVALGSLLARQLGQGVLTAAPGGLTFTPYSSGLRAARPDKAFEVPWTQVEVREGFVSRLDLAGRSIQVGPGNRAFARAAAARTGSDPER